MVFLNYSTMQMVAKVVYYGPGLCGKTTNLKEIYRKTSPKSRGEMVSLETETDRTLFFDLLPMDVGVIGGFKTKFQLYTVPGQVFYNSTRKLVLRGVDGIVFVADSQVPMMEANQSSIENLRENLRELSLEIHDIPLVFQYNKRDLPNISPIEELNENLNFLNRPFIESSALRGIGVFETLKEISKQTLLRLRAKALGKEQQQNQHPVSLKARDHNQKLKKEIKDESDHGKLKVEAENSVVKTARMEAPETGALPDGVSFDSYANDREVPPKDSATRDHIAEESSHPRIDPPAITEQNPNMIDTREPEEQPGAEPSLASLGLDFSEEDFDDEDSLDLDEFEGLEDSLGDLDLEEEAPDTDSEAVPVDLDSSARAVEETPAAEIDKVGDISSGGEDGETPAMALNAEVPEPIGNQEPEGEPAEARAAAHEDSTPPPEKPPPAKKKSPRNTLRELESIASQVTKPSRTSAGSVSVDSLLDSLVAETGRKKTRLERIKLVAPSAIDKAQLNCVLLDKADNVVHTQLLKVTPHEITPGHYQVKVLIDIEVEES